MIIDLIEHQDLIRGASSVEDAEEGVRCSRLTEDALEYYANFEKFALPSKFTTGIRISFVTDSSYFEAHLRQASSAEFVPYSVDVLVNGTDCHTFEADENDDGDDFIFSVELPEQEDNEVEIFLPYNIEVVVTSLELADGALFRPLYANYNRMLFLGDSIVSGALASSPVRAYTSQIAIALGVDYLNWGMPDSNIHNEIGDFAQEVEWQTAIVAYGANDYRNNCQAKASADELRKLLQKLCSRTGSNIYVITPLTHGIHEKGRNKTGSSLDDFRKSYKEVVKEFKTVKLIDGPSLVAPKEKYFQEDLLHPTDDGMAVIAENLYAKLEKWING